MTKKQRQDEEPEGQRRKQGGVQSVAVGMRLLKALAAIGGKATLNELAESVGMHPAKAHRYLVSLSDAGFTERTARGRYDLGPYVLELAIAYLSRLDPTAVAGPMIERLWSETDEGVILSVWGESGTTVIRWLQSRRPISVGIRPGSVFSALMSASGRVFLAYLPEQVTVPAVQTELTRFAATPDPLAPKSLEAVRGIVEETRRYGLARVEGHSIENVSALAAPVFDYRGQCVLALALFGFKATFDASWGGRNASLVKKAAAQISARLGYVSRESHLDSD